MQRQNGYAFSIEPHEHGDDQSADGEASALELRTELSEFLAETMHRLESLSEALMHCQTPAATPPTPQPQPTTQPDPRPEPHSIPEPCLMPEPRQALPPTQTPEPHRTLEPASDVESRLTPEAPFEWPASQHESSIPPQPAPAATIESDKTVNPTTMQPPNQPVALGAESVQQPVVPASTAPVTTTIDEVSAAGGDPPASPTPGFSASGSNAAAADPTSDPADRLAAIKLRLAKQIENA